MPLIVLSGQPCSGKSSTAAQLRELLQPHPVAVVDEPSLHLERNSAYQNVVQEKQTRGALKSAVERAISKKTIVILDSLNNIKGYRYELWCVARAAGTRYCMVHVATDTDTCRAWNRSRPEGERYSDAVFNDLAGRFETPDQRNRWDAPLFTLHPGQPDQQPILEAIAAAMTGTAQQQQRQQQQRQQQQQQQQQLSGALQQLSLNDGVPGAAEEQQQQLSAVLQQLSLSDSVPGAAEEQRVYLAAAAARGGDQLQPTCATTNPSLVATNLLHEMDTAVQAVVSRVMEVQQLSADAGGGSTLVDCGPAGQLRLERHLSLTELRRHKRNFLKLATKMAFSRLKDPVAAQRMFVNHLTMTLAGSA